MLKHWFWITGFFSIFAISSALIAEYIFSLEPCSMCLKQRYPYYFIITIFVSFYFINWLPRIWYFLGVQLSSVYGLFYSIWHVGIEQNILLGPISCSGGLNTSISAEDLKEQIMSKSAINCEDIIWSFFGISASTINSAFLFVIFLFNLLYIYKYYAQTKIRNS